MYKLTLTPCADWDIRAVATEYGLGYGDSTDGFFGLTLYTGRADDMLDFCLDTGINPRWMEVAA